MRFAVVLVPALVIASCYLSWSTSREQHAIPLDGGLALGSSIRVGALEVWPVLADESLDVGPFLTLEQAQERECVAIRESTEAQVNRLEIENRGDTPILACAGTVVTGGKQDRQLGEDLVVEARTTAAVKAFCVEQSRWSGDDSFRAPGLQASAPVRTAAQYGGDQGLVWHDIEVAQVATDAPRGSYGTVAETEDRRESAVEEIFDHLSSQEGNLVGYAYAIDGDAAGMRTFAHRALLEPRLDGFVRAMCVEAAYVSRGDLTEGMLEFTPPQITQVGVDESASAPGQVTNGLDDAASASFDSAGEEINLVPSAYRPADAELRRIGASLRMASDSYDEGEYQLAVEHARAVLALDPDNGSARELIRIAEETRYVASEDELREEFNAQWRTILEQLDADLLPAEQATPPRRADPVDLPTLFRELNAAPEEIEETGGANRNGYRRAEPGNHSTCYVETKDGRWVPLTRDWSAR